MDQKNLIFIANLVLLKQIVHPHEISSSLIFNCDIKSYCIINTILNVKEGKQFPN